MNSVISRTSALFLSLALFAALPGASAASCGDVDDSGAVTTTDALAVLRHAVQLGDKALSCEACVVPTTTSSTCCFDECFNDKDCVEQGHPEGWQCISAGNNGICVECQGSCPGDNECVNWICINACGDFDTNGRVAATDALRVLKVAVGADLDLYCPGCNPFNLPTTTLN